MGIMLFHLTIKVLFWAVIIYCLIRIHGGNKPLFQKNLITVSICTSIIILYAFNHSLYYIDSIRYDNDFIYFIRVYNYLVGLERTFLYGITIYCGIRLLRSNNLSPELLRSNGTLENLIIINIIAVCLYVFTFEFIPTKSESLFSVGHVLFLLTIKVVCWGLIIYCLIQLHMDNKSLVRKPPITISMCTIVIILYAFDSPYHINIDRIADYYLSPNGFYNFYKGLEGMLLFGLMIYCPIQLCRSNQLLVRENLLMISTSIGAVLLAFKNVEFSSYYDYQFITLEQDFIESLFLGWIDTITSYLLIIKVNYALVAQGTLFFLFFLVMGHQFSKWFYANYRAQPWRLRWTLSCVIIVMFIFVTSVSTTVIFHHVVWLSKEGIGEVWFLNKRVSEKKK